MDAIADTNRAYVMENSQLGARNSSTVQEEVQHDKIYARLSDGYASHTMIGKYAILCCCISLCIIVWPLSQLLLTICSQVVDRSRSAALSSIHVHP